MNIETWSVILLALFAPQKQEFHQGVDYRIEARLDEATNVLTGRGRMRYTNHSPDALDTLYFHLHLNAFRPNSAWATRELEFGNRRFQDLGPADHAFGRIKSMKVDGRAVTPTYPFAPDSTVVAVVLPGPIAPAATAVVDMDWTARTATVARRQGRAGRHYDWAHWYPRIAVYDTSGWNAQRLLPQGEFYGEFASYDVTLDVAADQVLGATGVPVTGDPGWEAANVDKTNPPLLKRDAYAPKNAAALGLLANEQAGRKRIRWRAENVIHFAWASDPAWVYEGGRHGDVALHSLYLPGDSLWPGRVMAEMKSSLAFFDSVMGPYVYPQLTSLRRVDNGGTEFPMVNMNGVNPPVNHEVAHEWVHAILANNEFEEGWLDEGFASYLGFMYAESKGNKPKLNMSFARLDSAGASQPIGLRSAEFRDFNMYQAMTYSKPAAVYHMLRYTIGDTAFRRGLRLYYDKNKLTHVDGNDYQAAMEQTSGQDLDWFFQQWIHTTNTLDYAVTNVESQQTSPNVWRTRVEITRDGEIWMPVDLKVGDKITRIETRDRVYNAFVETSEKPAEVVLDPEGYLIDIARENNRRAVN